MTKCSTFVTHCPFQRKKKQIPYEEIKKDNYSYSTKLWDIHSFAVKLQCNWIVFWFLVSFVIVIFYGSFYQKGQFIL